MPNHSLQLLDDDTVLGSSLCAKCPYTPAGCCIAPPRYDWSDLARVVRHGFRDWVLERLAAGDLVVIDHGLTIKRPKGRLTTDRGSPRLARCTFHEASRGCTIDERQRPATCNFYVCDKALEDADDAVAAARASEAHDALLEKFVAWDAELHERVKAWPLEERYTARFLDWLAAEHAGLRGSV